jgi:hypothetical protein
MTDKIDREHWANEALAFVVAHPEYYHHQANADAMIADCRSRRAAPSRENLHIAYENLKAQGKLILKPEEVWA